MVMANTLLPDGGDRDEPDDHHGENGGSRDTSLTPSICFGLLADRRDRFILYHLTERGGTVPLDTLATDVATWENKTEPELVTKEMEQRAHTRLVHASIPKLADHGIVATTPDREAVTLSDHGEQLQPYLEFAKEHEQEDVQSFLDQSTDRE